MKQVRLARAVLADDDRMVAEADIQSFEVPKIGDLETVDPHGLKSRNCRAEGAEREAAKVNPIRFISRDSRWLCCDGIAQRSNAETPHYVSHLPIILWI